VRMGVRSRCGVLSASVLTLLTSSTLGLSIDDVQVSHWVGSGSQRALLVVDWQQPQSVVFGYRWEGTKTVENMMQAIQEANTGLFIAWHPEYETAFGMGYDVNGDHSLFVAGSPGIDTETGNATDAGDYYAEGWYINGYWAYYQSNNGTDWAYAIRGVSQALVDGEWDGWSWSPASSGWDGGVPNNIPLAPEPASALMILVGTALACHRRRGA
jgi:hypothetical protein